METQGFLKKIKVNESTISMVLGALVIIVVGVLVINYFRGRDAGETIPAVQTEDVSLTQKKHVIASGEGLWAIAELYYEDGEKWVEIARVNNIENPNEIEVGQEIVIPALAALIADADTGGEESQTEEMATEDTETPEPTAETEETQEEEVENQESDTEEETTEETEDHDNSDEENAEETAEEEKSVEPTNEPTDTPSPEPTAEPTAEPETIAEDNADEQAEDKIEGEKYVVVKGDSLWTIAERAYGDGYKWVEIAKANDLANPNIIHTGNEFILPR